jgi:hypothetical protein
VQTGVHIQHQHSVAAQQQCDRDPDHRGAICSMTCWYGPPCAALGSHVQQQTGQCVCHTATTDNNNPWLLVRPAGRGVQCDRHSSGCKEQLRLSMPVALPRCAVIMAAVSSKQFSMLAACQDQCTC